MKTTFLLVLLVLTVSCGKQVKTDGPSPKLPNNPLDNPGFADNDPSVCLGSNVCVLYFTNNSDGHSEGSMTSKQVHEAISVSFSTIIESSDHRINLDNHSASLNMSLKINGSSVCWYGVNPLNPRQLALNESCRNQRFNLKVNDFVKLDNIPMGDSVDVRYEIH